MSVFDEVQRSMVSYSFTVICINLNQAIMDIIAFWISKLWSLVDSKPTYFRFKFHLLDHMLLSMICLYTLYFYSKVLCNKSNYLVTI